VRSLLAFVFLAAVLAPSRSVPAGESDGPAVKAAPKPGDVFSFTVGELPVTALCDTVFSLPKDLLLGATPEQVAKYLPSGSSATSVNAYVVKLNGKNILFDAGAGRFFDGQPLAVPLANAGLKPDDIDVIVLTHMHLDHAGGLLDNDQPLFPKAEVWVSGLERDFWLDDAAVARLSDRLSPILGKEFVAAHAGAARKVLSVYGERVHVFSEGQEFLPGVEPLPAYGHTPGHNGYLIEAGSDNRFLIWGDLLHIAEVQFPVPSASMIFDTDPEAAVVTRERVLGMAAEKGWTVAGMHLRFPGAGRVEKAEPGYRFTAAY
jgi:glyoxylase-like metal-dependent hydrolase (beta-lactamase superfamily II)